MQDSQRLFKKQDSAPCLLKPKTKVNSEQMQRIQSHLRLKKQINQLNKSENGLSEISDNQQSMISGLTK